MQNLMSVHCCDPERQLLCLAFTRNYIYRQASPNRRHLHEAEIYETLQEHPHPSLGRSLGCVVSRDDRTTGFVLLKYKATLFERAHDASSFGLDERSQCISAIKSALDHLHSLGLAHLSPLNVMFTDKGEPV
ncbi:hypothetical protein BGZ61DRAFT_591350 [Ilyonectria robusta]|uniref:uncharacterized protein n=1 Tax=Ilyonectria robusta TaxID=1079257 RepID=UPI001E8CA3B8|nr:uncharacterized protein BGZ61DRAFT_591350 [Ilyonectria robusta]KAH8675033.1 hypothetical protein BGZ61DRAFT_591350 [Ilyonectria robusta]